MSKPPEKFSEKESQKRFEAALKGARLAWAQTDGKSDPEDC
jgi:hypothetical protein